MKAIAMGLIVGLGLLSSTSALAASPARREVRQQARIADGVKSGQLTPKETAKLEAREASIHRDIERSRAKDGGHLDARDRARIERRQDRTSRAIYREKHDGQTR